MSSKGKAIILLCAIPAVPGLILAVIGAFLAMPLMLFWSEEVGEYWGEVGL